MMKKTLFTLMVTAFCGFVFAEASNGISPNWIYLPSEGMISNDVWSLRVVERSGNELEADGGNDRCAFIADRCGEIMDFSGKITTLQDNEGAFETWTVTRFADNCFSPSASIDGVERFKSIIFPSTVEDLGTVGLLSHVTYYKLKRVVLVSDTFAGAIPEDFVYGQTDLERVEINVPEVTTIARQAFRNAGHSDAKIDFSNWNLTGVTTIRDNALRFAKGSTGALDLPNVTTIERNVVNGMGITSLFLGTNSAMRGRTLYLGNNAPTQPYSRQFGNCTALTNVVIGPYADVTYQVTAPNGLDVEGYMNEFINCPNIREVRFLGAPLAHTEDFLDRVLVSVPVPSDGTKQVVVRASGILGWDRFAKTDYSAGELAAKTALEATLADGEAVMGVYETRMEDVDEGGLRKAWLVHSPSPDDGSAYSFTCFDDRFATIKFIQGAPVNGALKVGSTVRIEAECHESEFVRWEGLPEGVTVGEDPATVEFVVGYDPIRITLHTKPFWFYLPNEGVISNRAWSLNVERVNGNEASDRRLKIGTGREGSAYTARGEGILDLSGRIWGLDDAGAANQAEEWMLTHFGKNCLAPTSSSGSKKLSRIIFPQDVASFGEGVLDASVGTSGSNAHSILTDVVLESDSFGGMIPVHFLYYQNQLTNVTIRMPNATSIGKEAFRHAGRAGARIDFSTWDLRSVTRIEDNGLRITNGSTGSVDLPSVTDIARNILNGTGITSLLLGTNSAMRGRTLYLGNNDPTQPYSRQFGNCMALTNVVIGPYADVTYQVTASNGLDVEGYMNEFINCPNIREVRFLGAPLAHTEDFLDRVLVSVPVSPDGTKQVVVHASGILGWDRFAKTDYSAEELVAKTTLEETLAPHERVLGVYETHDGEQRKAWLVHTPSEYDPKGTILVVR